MEIWHMHLLFMAVFFGLPAGLAYRSYRKWRRTSGISALDQIKKDIGY